MNSADLKEYLNKISREDLIKAMEEIDKADIPTNRQSMTYDVLNPSSNNTYPPPLLIEYAYKISTEDDLPKRFFDSIGKASTHFKFLKDLGFQIRNKKANFFKDSDIAIQKPNFLLKRIKKQDLKREFFILKKLTGKDNFFLSPEIEDPKPKGNKPHLINLSFKWHNLKSNVIINPLKKYIRDIHGNEDIRLAKTEKLTLDGNPIAIIKKNNNKEYEAWIYKEGDKNYDISDKLLGNKAYMLTSNILEDIVPKTKRINHPLNQILYGPPGTGKTYSTITKALEIIGTEYNNYEEAQELFQNELGKRIEFVTMHQSFSYEDFVQGLKPLPSVDNKGVVFDYKNGVFKEICRRASEYSDEGTSKTLQKNVSLNDRLIVGFFISKFNGRKKEDQIANKTLNVSGFSEAFKLISDKLDIKVNTIKAYRDQFDYKFDHRNGYAPKNSMISVQAGTDKLDAPYDAIYNEYDNKSFEEVKEEVLKILRKSENTRLVTNISNNDNFVIILDEINRANISRVFGELIALIEKDKRDGKLTATLPSGEAFTVPSNLYIIGTMNTADKSIALVDIALRRRFEFIPLYPNSNTLKKVLKEKGIKDVEQRVALFTNLNKIIRAKKSVDFEIGHSYFMDEDTLVNILNKQVLPLLNEYFMYDLRKVQNILEKPQKDRDGNEIPKLDIELDKDIWKNRGLLEVKSFGKIEEVKKAIELEGIKEV